MSKTWTFLQETANFELFWAFLPFSGSVRILVTVKQRLFIVVSRLILVLGVSAGCNRSAEAQTNSPPPIERSHFVYYFDDPRYVDFADSVLNNARVQLSNLLGDTLNYKPSVYLISNLDRFRELIGGGFPDWGAAAAVPHKGRMVIKSPDHFNLNRPLAQLLIHEYAHLALDHRTGIMSAPRWFNEGLAMMVSAEWDWSKNLAMSKAAVFGQLIPLREIELVNRFSEGKANLAYAESQLAANYLFEGYSRDAVSIFLDAIAAGKSLDEALMASTGSNYADFEREFRLYLEERFNLTSLFVDTMWFWLALAVIVMVGAFFKFRKRRSYYKKWEEHERLHSTDFDYGDPDHPEQIDDDEPWRQS
jgi:hypothetical protein